MKNIDMTRLAKKLQDFELHLEIQDDHEVISAYVHVLKLVRENTGQVANSRNYEVEDVKILAEHKELIFTHALREAISDVDKSTEAEALNSLGDLHLKKGMLSIDSAEFDKAAALYAAALLHCTDPDKGQTLKNELEHSKHCRELLQGFTPQKESPDFSSSADSNVLRVAKICDKLDRNIIENSHCSIERAYTEMLVTAIGTHDTYLEVETLKCLGDFYLEKGKKKWCEYQYTIFFKALAMYNRAFRRCEDTEMKQTLMHRIKYTEQCLLPVMDKVIALGRRRQLQNFLQADNTQDSKLHPDKASQYSYHLKEGDSSLARADLDSAEKHFATALKTVHKNDPTAQQYQREVEPLCKLGDVYSKRGQQTGDGGDFVKAAALYNAAIARSEDQVLNGNIETAIREVENSFLNCVLHIRCKTSKDDTERHKKQLKEMRDQIKLEMETIDQQLDPYVHDEDDPCVKEIEAKRAQAVRHLFENIAQQRKEFISLLVEECIGLMGPPPCKYAMIGLGSQATGLVTPYSDLEFAILVEEESEECLVYLRNLTHYLHLKVVNLGETILPTLGIKSLNNFYSESPLDNWYYDSVTPRGFAFDGSMPKASKTPLGRQGTVDDPTSELICTPENMASKLQQDVTLYLKEGYHLATILRNSCLIAGDQDLIDTYMAITGKILQDDGGKMGQQLAEETLNENTKRYLSEQTITDSLMDVKKQIYRFPTVAVDYLALSSGIIPTTVWKTIEEMKNQQVISPNNAHHLTVLTSISAELRLRTYIANGGQKENLSALVSMETAQHGQQSSTQTNDNMPTNALKPVFHLPNEKLLFRYFFSAFPLQSILFEHSGERSKVHTFSNFYDSSSYVQGMMYAGLCKFRLASKYFHKALKEYSIKDTKIQKAKLFKNLGDALHNLGDNQKAISYYEQALKTYRVIYGQTKSNRLIANTLSGLGIAWTDLSNYRKALGYFEQELQMNRSIYSQTRAHPYLASSLNNMGITWRCLGDCRKAIIYLEQALQVEWSTYMSCRTREHLVKIAMFLGNLGSTCGDLRDHRKTISYQEKALQIYRQIYGQTTAHLTIARSFNSIGWACIELGDHKKAISYLEKALQMYRSIYGQGVTHPYIASALNNLGGAWYHLGDYRKATIYYEQALQIHKSIYGENIAHIDRVSFTKNLGCMCCLLGNTKKAIRLLKEAYVMARKIHPQGKCLKLVKEIELLLNLLNASYP